MSNEEFGAYWRLVCYSWEEPLPSDLGDLALMLPRTTKKQMERMWRVIGPCFTLHPSQPGKLIQARIEEEREKQAANREKQAENGRKGGRPKQHLGSEYETQEKPTGYFSESETEPKKSLSFSFPFSIGSNEPAQAPETPPDSGGKPSDFAAYAILDAAWPVISDRHEMAIKRKDWRSHNKRAAAALADNGKTAEDVVAMLTVAYEHPEGSRFYGNITTLAKLIEHWPKLAALDEPDDSERQRAYARGDYLPRV